MKDIESLWPQSGSPAAALRARLAEDSGHTVFSLIHNGDGLEELRMATPRFRLRGFVDRRHRQTLLIKRIQASSMAEWRRECSRGTQIKISWALEGEPIAALFGLETLMGQLNLRNDKRAPPAAFWGFWGEYLDLEREMLERLRKHPGWPYDRRRYGAGGTIEFHVAEASEELQCQVSRPFPRKLSRPAWGCVRGSQRIFCAWLDWWSAVGLAGEVGKCTYDRRNSTRLVQRPIAFQSAPAGARRSPTRRSSDGRSRNTTSVRASNRETWTFVQGTTPRRTTTNSNDQR